MGLDFISKHPIFNYLPYLILLTNFVSGACEVGRFNRIKSEKQESEKEKSEDCGKIFEVKPIIPTPASPFPLIDCDSTPTIPSGLSIAKPEFQLPKIVKGKIEWNSSSVSLYLSEGQKGNERITGFKLKEELKSKKVYPASVLDYLLENQDQIPESWKGKYVFFWGTVYSDASGDVYVRCLYFYGSRWTSLCNWLDDVWGGSDPAAVCASVT